MIYERMGCQSLRSFDRLKKPKPKAPFASDSRGLRSNRSHKMSDKNYGRQMCSKAMANSIVLLKATHPSLMVVIEQTKFGTLTIMPSPSIRTIT